MENVLRQDRGATSLLSRIVVPTLLIASLALGACGGGGNGGNELGRPPPPPPPPRAAGALSFATNALPIGESAGTVVVTVARTAGSSGAISVDVVSADGTAAAGQDYLALRTTVNFADGDSAGKTVALTIIDDQGSEPFENFKVTLSNPTGGATLQGPDEINATIIIEDDDAPSVPAVPSAPSLTMAPEVKRLAFAWFGAARATSYRLMRRENSAVDFVQVGSDLAGTVTSAKITIPVHASNWASDVPQYRVDACNAVGCTPSNVVDPIRVLSALTTGYLKAADTAANAQFGTSIAVSGDGRTVAIGAPFADAQAGSVYIYTAPLSGPVLAPQPVKISAPSAQDMLFGYAVALSEDGDTLAVGAPFDSNRQSGIGLYPDQPNTDAFESGGVFIYSRTNGAWSPEPVYVKAGDVEANDQFGIAVALSSATLVVGAPGQDNQAPNSGAVYTFAANTGDWMPASVLKASNIGEDYGFGYSVALAASGSVIIVGAPDEAGDGKAGSGAVYRFVEVGVKIPENPPQWSPPQRFTADNSDAADFYGIAVAVNSTGDVFAVGASGDDGTLPDGEEQDFGAVYAYTIADSVVTDVAYLQATHRYDRAYFGTSVAMNGDGSLLAVGSPRESIDETGVDGEQIGPALESGAVDVLTRAAGENWSSQGDAAPRTHYIKASNTDAGDLFGSAVSLSNDGNTLVVGAPGEAGNGTNLSPNNNPENNSAFDAGAAYLY